MNGGTRGSLVLTMKIFSPKNFLFNPDKCLLPSAGPSALTTDVV